MKIDINKKYRTTRDKWPVTIVSTDGPYPGFPVIGYAHTSGTPLLCHWAEGGGYPANKNLDLIEVLEPREWTIYADRDQYSHLPFLGADAVQVREILD